MNTKKIPIIKLKYSDLIVINQKVYTITSITTYCKSKENDWRYDITSIDVDNHVHINSGLKCDSMIDVPVVSYDRYMILDVDNKSLLLYDIDNMIVADDIKVQLGNRLDNSNDISQTIEKEGDVVINIKNMMNRHEVTSVEIRLNWHDIA